MPDLGYAIVFVADLEASVAFYRDVLGVEHRFTDAGYAEFGTGSARLALYERRRVAWLTGREARPGPAAEVVLMVDDVDAEAARLAAAGVPLLSPPTDRAWGHRTCHVADPDGFVVELAQEVPRARTRADQHDLRPHVTTWLPDGTTAAPAGVPADRLVTPVDTSAVSLDRPTAADAEEFVAAAARSAGLHDVWVTPPVSVDAFLRWLRPDPSTRTERFIVRTAEGHAIAGFVSVQQIAAGRLRSGALGYGAFVPYAGHGLMTAGVAAVVRHCFTALPAGLGLHRVEACIRPENTRSLALVRRLGFRHEGTSPRLLFLDGAWRDHERFALTVEDWSR